MASEPTAGTAADQPATPAKGPRWGAGAAIILMALALLIGFFAGAITGAVWSPWFVNDVIRQEFITGPPAAGAFAVLAAAIAALAAVWSTVVTQKNSKAAVKQAKLASQEAVSQAYQASENAERWHRMQWAMDKALSRDATVGKAGVVACKAIVTHEKSSAAELRMLRSATSRWGREEAGVDTDDLLAQNRPTTKGSDQHG